MGNKTSISSGSGSIIDSSSGSATSFMNSSSGSATSFMNSSSGSANSFSGSGSGKGKYPVLGAQENVTAYLADLKKYKQDLDDKLQIVANRGNYQMIYELQNLYIPVFLMKNNLLSIDFTNKNILNEIVYLLNNNSKMLMDALLIVFIGEYYVPILLKELVKGIA